MKTQSHRDWVLEALEEHELALTRYALRLLGDLESARDVVQHAFLKLCEHSAEKLAGGERKWLYTVCRNRALDCLRMSGRRAGAEPSGDDENQHYGNVVGREPDPADVAVAGELAAQLRQLVQTLPALQQETIDLWCDGFAYRDIAEIIQRKEGHVRVLVHRGLAALREHPQVRAWLEEGCVSEATRTGHKIIAK